MSLANRIRRLCGRPLVHHYKTDHGCACGFRGSLRDMARHWNTRHTGAAGSPEKNTQRTE